MLKSKKILLLHDVEKKNFNRTEKKVRNRNVATFYQIATIFNFDKLEKFSLCYIERCFPIVCKKNNFKNLSLALFAKIISSSELNIDSEVEVINAVNNWISYDFEERSKFANRLLSKVRLNLLSIVALNSILESELSISKIDDCVSILTKGFKNNESCFKNKRSRYCTQDMYNLILSGGNIKNKVSDVTNQFNVKNFNNVKQIDPLRIKRAIHRSVYCRGEVYVFGGFNESHHVVKSVEKYSLATNRWEIIAEMFDDRKGFEVCRFNNKLYVFGGCDKEMNQFLSCKMFNTNNNIWYGIKRMNKARISVASTIYEERIVVSGGMINDGMINIVKTVDAYDPFANSWSSMPNMIKARCNHSSVAVRNKLFVIGSDDWNGSKSCEVFDSSYKKFVMLKKLPSAFTFNLRFVANTFSIGNKLITIGYKSSTALYYDVEKDEWSEETFNLTNNKSFFSSISIPQIKF